MEGLPLASRSTEDYGTLLTAELVRAAVLDEPVLAVCIDLSKAYDSVRIDLLESFLEGQRPAKPGLEAHAGHGPGPEAAQGHDSSWCLGRPRCGHRSRLPSCLWRWSGGGGAV